MESRGGREKRLSAPEPAYSRYNDAAVTAEKGRVGRRLGLVGQKMANGEKLVIWARGDVIIRGLLPLPPPANLTFTNLVKVVSYVKSRTVEFPLISFDSWKRVSEKMSIPIDVAKIYYWVFVNLTEGALQDGAPLDQSIGLGQVPVNLVQFLLFLLLQSLNKTTINNSNFLDDVFPGAKGSSPTSTPSGVDSVASPRESTQSNATLKYLDKESDNRLQEFLQQNVENFLKLIWIGAHDQFKDSLGEIPENMELDIGSLSALDLLLEGKFLGDHQEDDVSDFQPIPFSYLMRNEILSSLRVQGSVGFSMKDVIILIRESLVDDPFCMVPCVPIHPATSVHRVSSHSSTSSIQGTKTGQAYLAVTNAPVNRRLVIVRSIVKQAVIKSTKAMEGTYLTVSGCRNSQLYLATHFNSAAVERCRGATLVIGPTENVVRLQSCHNCTFLLVCRRLIISDCQSCKIYVKTPTRPLLLGGSNSDLELGPYHSWYPELENQMENVGLSTDHCDMWNRPISLVTGDVKPMSARQGDAALCWRKTDPEDFFPFSMPFASGDKPSSESSVKILGDLPPEYEKAWRDRLERYDMLFQKLRSFPEEDREWIQAQIKEKFAEFQKGSGTGKQLEQLKTLENMKKRKARRRRSSKNLTPSPSWKSPV